MIKLKNQFSSPVFGDMFLLINIRGGIQHEYTIVFVSYIRRYVLTSGSRNTIKTEERVFVSYIRRYVLTGRKNKFMEVVKMSFRLLYSEICSY